MAGRSTCEARAIRCCPPAAAPYRHGVTDRRGQGRRSSVCWFVLTGNDPVFRRHQEDLSCLGLEGRLCAGPIGVLRDDVADRSQHPPGVARGVDAGSIVDRGLCRAQQATSSSSQAASSVPFHTACASLMAWRRAAARRRRPRRRGWGWPGADRAGRRTWRRAHRDGASIRVLHGK